MPDGEEIRSHVKAIAKREFSGANALMDQLFLESRLHIRLSRFCLHNSFSIARMSSPASSAVVRCCQRASRLQTRSLSSQCLRPSILSCNYQRRKPTSRRWQSTEAAAAPTNPKISVIVDQISQLTLLETADLVASLKVCYARDLECHSFVDWLLDSCTARHNHFHLCETET